jgi:hypothetical protein
MRKSSRVFLYIALNIIFLAMAFAHSAWQREQSIRSLREQSELARALELTDLCLFTEARYTRNPSQADFHAPFQDHPGSLEHFPSGSLVTPRKGGAEQHANLD